MSATVIAAGVTILALLLAWATLYLAPRLVRGDKRAADRDPESALGAVEGAHVHGGQNG